MSTTFSDLHEIAKARVKSLIERLKQNPNDKDALYDLSLSYEYGWGGLLENSEKANYLLEKTANLGHQDARNTWDRKFLEAKLIKDQENRNTKERSDVEEMLHKKGGVEEAIEKEIFPCVVSISTPDGIGTGFFQHGLWLVSNAHVLPTFEHLSKATITNPQITDELMVIERSFHRPNEKAKSPDIIIANLQSRPDNNTKGLLIDFSDDNLSKPLFFYVYFDPDKKIHITKYLIPLKLEGFPLFFKCEDGSDPQSGCSGSPVIEARITMGASENIWKFRTIGMVYARCTSPTKDPQKPVCVIPVRLDFEQIRLEILSTEEESLRHSQTAHAHTLLHQNQQAIRSLVKAKTTKLEAKRNFQNFMDGKTVLDICLPSGLEKLIGKKIIKLEQSMLLAKNQKQYPKERRFENTAETLKHLQDDLDAFYEAISKEKIHQLKVNNNPFLKSPSGFFRIDLLGGSNTAWKLDLQDNTGIFKFRLSEDHRKKLYPDDGKPKPPNNPEPASSVFAIVTIPTNIKSISGHYLLALLKNSIDTQDRAQYSAEPEVSPIILKKNQTTSKELKEKRSQEFFTKKIQKDTPEEDEFSILDEIDEFSKEAPNTLSSALTPVQQQSSSSATSATSRSIPSLTFVPQLKNHQKKYKDGDEKEKLIAPAKPK